MKVVNRSGEFDSPNHTEYIYEKRATRRIVVGRICLVFFYVAFVVAFFCVCIATVLVPLFAMCPLFLWMIIYFTWRLVSYEVYYVIDHGRMELGKVKRTKNGYMHAPVLSFSVKDTVALMPAGEFVASPWRERVAWCYDFSARDALCETAVVVAYGGEHICVIIECTPQASAIMGRCIREAGESEEIDRMDEEQSSP